MKYKECKHPNVFNCAFNAKKMPDKISDALSLSGVRLHHGPSINKRAGWQAQTTHR